MSVPVSFEPGFTQHPKLVAAGPNAAWLWMCAVDYSVLNLTDGEVGAAALEKLASFDGVYTEARVGEQPILLPQSGAYVPVDHSQLVQVLASQRLLHETPTGVVVHDFAEHQLTRGEVMQLAASEQRRRLRDVMRKRHRRRGPELSGPLRSSDNGKACPRTLFKDNYSDSEVRLSASTQPATTRQSSAVESLPDQHRADAVLHDVAARVAAARSQLESDPIGYVVERLRSYRCAHCSRRFSTPHQLHEHLRADHDVAADLAALAGDPLGDAERVRTYASIRSTLAKWNLPDSAVLKPFESLQQRIRNRKPVHQPQGAYINGGINKIGEERAA